jgi:predicted nucleic acid-binding protein
MSVAKAFFDTNILLCLYGGGDPVKKAKAAELFSAQTRTARAVVSTQVVQEFYAVATRKLGMAATWRVASSEACSIFRWLSLTRIRSSRL